MKSKRTYRTESVERIDVARLTRDWVPQAPVTVAVDAAKTKFVAAVSCGQQRVLVRWEHPRQSEIWLTLLDRLRELGHEPSVVMEPTGTYGDALRHQLYVRRMAVYRVQPKHVHDGAELFDGVPSSHDAKAAAMIEWLHAQGRSARWVPKAQTERQLRGWVELREVHAKPLEQLRGRLEALLARYFPELEQVVDVDCRSVLKLLAQMPSPTAIAAESDAVTKLLWSASRGRIGTQRVAALLQAASRSLGVAMLPSEENLLAAIAREMVRHLDELKQIDEAIAGAVDEVAELSAMRQTLGAVTTAVIVAHTGSPAEYGSAGAFEKACGLNLKERSSGNHQGRLGLTKRGPSIVRRYLYLAALRLIREDPVVVAWYQRRRSYGQSKLKAVVAVMRKLARALVHLARGEPWDPSKLFDVRRLRPRTEVQSLEVPMSC